MGKLSIDIILWDKEPNSGFKSDPTYRCVEVREIDLQQTTYHVRRAVYDLYGLHLDFIQELDASILVNFLEHEQLICEKERAKHFAMTGEKGNSNELPLTVFWNGKPIATEKDGENTESRPDLNYLRSMARTMFRFHHDTPPSMSQVTVMGFSLREPRHLASLDYLLGLVNDHFYMKKIPKSAYVTEDKEITTILTDIQASVKRALEKTFGNTPLHIGLSFLQPDLSRPIIVRITQMTSVESFVQPVLVYQAPLVRIAQDKIEKYSEWIFTVLPLVAPATFRVTPESILLIEMVQPVPQLPDDDQLSITLTDFYMAVEGAAGHIAEALPVSDPLDPLDVDYLFRVPSLANLDMNKRKIQWEYLRSSAVIKRMQASRPEEDITAYIDGVLVQETKDMLLYDQLQEYVHKGLLDHAFSLVGKMVSPAYKMLGIRVMADIAIEHQDENTLRQVLGQMALFLDTVETFQENLISRLRDLLVVVSEQLGLTALLEMYPVKASPQIRLAWLSGAFRSSPRLLMQNEKEWLVCLSKLITEMAQTPLLFMPLLDELIDMVQAMAFMPQWHRQANELIDLTLNIAAGSEYSEYYQTRLERIRKTIKI